MHWSARHRPARTGSCPGLWREFDPLAALGVVQGGNDGFLALDLDPRDFGLPFVAALRFLALKKAHTDHLLPCLKVETRVVLAFRGASGDINGVNSGNLTKQRNQSSEERMHRAPFRRSREELGIPPVLSVEC